MDTNYIYEGEEYNLDDYKYTGDGSPAVYVGTYAKYNNCNLFGEWLDLTKFSDYEEFIDVCRYLHRDEEDPEFMAQDYEGFPERYYTEGFISEEQFDKIIEYEELDDDDKEMLEAYLEWQCCDDADIDDVRDACKGRWDSEEDFAYDYVESCGMLEGIPDEVARYFNYSAFTRDLFMDYYFDGTFVWDSNC